MPSLSIELPRTSSALATLFHTLTTAGTKINFAHNPRYIQVQYVNF